MIKLNGIENYNEYIQLVKEMSNRSADVCKLIGTIIFFIYSKDVFKKNNNLPDFIQSVFDIEYKSYVYKSRSTLVAKCSRKIYLAAESERNSIQRKFIDYFIFDDEKTAKKRNENDKLAKWLNN